MHLRIVVLLAGVQFTHMNIIVFKSPLILLSDCIKQEEGEKKKPPGMKFKANAAMHHSGMGFISYVKLSSCPQLPH